MSDEHQFALEKCWPPMVKRSGMLRNAHVFVHSHVKPAANLTDVAFNLTRGFTIKQVKKNLGYQWGAIEGAKSIMRHKTDWFADYDWIIRMNPDVIIRNDAPFYNLMTNKSVDGIFVNCNHPQFSETKIHTDFYAIRPTALPLESSGGVGSAEMHWTVALRSTEIFKTGRSVWLPDATYAGGCRVGGVGSPVVHQPSFLKHCQGNLDASDGRTFRA